MNNDFGNVCPCFLANPVLTKLYPNPTYPSYPSLHRTKFLLGFKQDRNFHSYSLNISKSKKPEELFKTISTWRPFQGCGRSYIWNASYQTSDCIHMRSNFFRGRSILLRGNKTKHASAKIIMSVMMMNTIVMKTKKGRPRLAMGDKNGDFQLQFEDERMKQPKK